MSALDCGLIWFLPPTATHPTCRRARLPAATALALPLTDRGWQLTWTSDGNASLYQRTSLRSDLSFLISSSCKNFGTRGRRARDLVVQVFFGFKDSLEAFPSRGLLVALDFLGGGVGFFCWVGWLVCLRGVGCLLAVIK